MSPHNTQSDDTHAADAYNHSTDKSTALNEQLAEIAVSPVGWTFIDPPGDGSLADIDLTDTGGEY